MRVSLRSVLAFAFVLPVLAHADVAHVRQQLIAGGASPKLAQRIERHVELGMPSSATRKNDSDFLLPRNGYVISYNGKRNAMNWVSWSLTKDDLGPAPRSNNFRPDRTLPARFYVPNSGDYKIPGYSRGHMVRSGERTATSRENSKTYVFTNMLPQAMNNNTGPWNMFEDFYRDAVNDQGKVAHIYAGGIWGKSPVPQRGVAVPSATWKIVALTEAGEPTDKVTEKTRVVAIIVPNNNDTVKVEQTWGQYRTSVAEIEKQTGLKFFSELPPALAAKIKNQVDTGPVPPPGPRQWTPHNWQPNGQQPAAQQRTVQKLVATQVSGKVKWFDATKNYGFITMPDGKDVYVNASNRLTSINAGDSVTFDVALGTDGRTFALKVKSLDPNATPIAQKWSAPAGGNDAKPHA